MNVLSLFSGLLKLGAAFFGWLRDRPLFNAGRTSAERDQAHDTLSKLDKVKRFRDRVDSDPRYSAELQRKYNVAPDGLRVPPAPEDKPG